MTITLQLVNLEDWKALLPMLERLKIKYKIESPKPPVNSLQQLLLTGPTANAEDLQFIEEKQSQFKQWK